jgi:signal transduction histidine kinase
MPTKSRKCSKSQRKTIWTLSACGWLGLGFLLGSEAWTWEYGSFLPWAVSAAFFWDRKAPFIATAFFLTASVCLQWDVLSMNPWHWFSRQGFWTALIFLSCLASSLGVRLGKEQGRVRKLERTLAQAARLTVLGRMTSGICHELKNHIAVVVGYLEQLQEDEELKPHERKIERSLLANEKMLQVLIQMREMSRELGQETIQPILLQETIQNALLFLDRPLLYRGITVTSTAVPPTLAAMGHGPCLQALLVHLMQHSLENFEQHPSKEGRTIQLDVEHRADEIHLHYRDNSHEPKGMNEMDRVVARQLMARQSGSLEWSPADAKGWAVTLRFKSAPHRDIPKPQDARAAS